MAILKGMPPPFTSVDELLAMSHALEKEAARRYRDLAAAMRLRQDEQLAELFDFLASIEEKHAKHIEERASEIAGKSLSPQQISWEMPENFDGEEGSSRMLTRYRALAIAVRNEERAFAFYSYIAAEARDEKTRALAEELAKDELDHAFLLRRERRKAYRERGRKEALQLPATVEELFTLAARTEWRAAAYHGELARQHLEKEKRPSAFAQAAADEARCAKELAARIGLPLGEKPAAASPDIEQGLVLLEEIFETYADVAERSKNEKVVQEAQILAERAVRRLSLVHGSRSNVLLDLKRA